MASHKKIKSQKSTTPIRLNMTFEQAMKKALNTPLPLKKIKKKNN